MKSIIFLLGFLLVGCGVEDKVDDRVDERLEQEQARIEAEIARRVEVEVTAALEYYAPYVDVINGQTYIRIAEYCIAVDPDDPYPDGFTHIAEFDGYRGRYSSAELFYCKPENAQ